MNKTNHIALIPLLALILALPVWAGDRDRDRNHSDHGKQYRSDRYYDDRHFNKHRRHDSRDYRLERRHHRYHGDRHYRSHRSHNRYRRYHNYHDYKRPYHGGHKYNHGNHRHDHGRRHHRYYHSGPDDAYKWIVGGILLNEVIHHAHR